MKQAIKFNTGRQYTAEGQIITAWVHSEKRDEFGVSYTVRFFDESRHVMGEISNLIALDKTMVMVAYDAGNYQSVWFSQEEVNDAQAKTSR